MTKAMSNNQNCIASLAIIVKKKNKNAVDIELERRNRRKTFLQVTHRTAHRLHHEASDIRWRSPVKIQIKINTTICERNEPELYRKEMLCGLDTGRGGTKTNQRENWMYMASEKLSQSMTVSQSQCLNKIMPTQEVVRI